MHQTTFFAVCLLLVFAFAGCRGAGWPLTPTWDAKLETEKYSREAAEMMLTYWLNDASDNSGGGRSDGKTSGNLAWGESAYLMNYILCYYALRDTAWLDKVVDHFDRMMLALDDHNTDGFLSWHDDHYSLAIVQVVSKEKTDGLTLSPELSRPTVKTMGNVVTGDDYSIAFPDPATVEIRDETKKETLGRKPYKDGMEIKEIPGAKLTLKGKPAPGACFWLSSVAAEQLEFQVHDGMITYPIVQFIELVYANPALHPHYKAKADAYLNFVGKHMLAKWERYWMELPNGGGCYKFTEHRTQGFPSEILPHNQYLALARTYVVLKDVADIPNRSVYLEKAAKMARYFKSCLKDNGPAYVWNYWGPPNPDIKRHIEDASHGTIDIGFVVEACNRGVVFDAGDMKRFARTYTDVMWNGSLDNPLIAGNVAGHHSRLDGSRLHEYIKLSQFDEKVWKVCAAVYERSGRSAGSVPSILYMVAGMAGIPPDALDKFRRLRQKVEESSKNGTICDGSFEGCFQGARAPLFWQSGHWNAQGDGFAQLVEGGRNGRYAIMLKGTKAPVNLAVTPRSHLPRLGAEKVTLKAWYRTEGDTKPDFSLLGYDGKSAKPIQYDTSPTFPPAAEWKEARWEVVLKPDGVEFMPVLRNHGLGTVYYDDFELVRQPQGGR